MTTMKDAADVNRVHCSLCGTSAPVVKVNGILPDCPDGWATVTIDQRGQRMRSTRSCPGCVAKVKALLNQLGSVRALKTAYASEGSIG